MTAAVKTKTGRRRKQTKAEEAGPELLPSGRWRIYVWDNIKQTKIYIKNPEPGSRGTWATAADAILAREEYKARLDGAYEAQGIPVQRQVHRAPVFKVVAEAWFKLQDGTKSTKKTKKTAMNSLIREFGERPSDEITRDEVRAANVAWGEPSPGRPNGYSRSWRELKLVVFRQIMTYAQDELKIRSDNPVRGVSVKVHRAREPRYLTDQEFLYLTHFLPIWFVAGAFLAYEVGMRAGEVAGLTWDRLVLDGPVPRVLVQDIRDVDGTLREYPKGGDPEWVPLSPRTVDALNHLRAYSASIGVPTEPTDIVFVKVKPISRDHPNYELKKAWKRSGLTGQRPVFHHLRHSCGTGTVEAGGDITDVMGQLRHKSPKTALRYLKKAQLAKLAAVQQRRVALENERLATVTELPRTPQTAEELVVAS